MLLIAALPISIIKTGLRSHDFKRAFFADFFGLVQTVIHILQIQSVGRYVAIAEIYVLECVFLRLHWQSLFVGRGRVNISSFLFFRGGWRVLVGILVSQVVLMFCWMLHIFVNVLVGFQGCSDFRRVDYSFGCFSVNFVMPYLFGFEGLILGVCQDSILLGSVFGLCLEIATLNHQSFIDDIFNFVFIATLNLWIAFRDPVRKFQHLLLTIQQLKSRHMHELLRPLNFFILPNFLKDQINVDNVVALSALIIKFYFAVQGRIGAVKEYFIHNISQFDPWGELAYLLGWDR